ncbi:MAG: hypothetical protein CMN77_10920 [Spirochaetaceae bacterium]|nr:hypothetical protein [Spirochaetaceae bacterium]|tara:strand:- start:8229 stop:9884 length:1656 start_codon:yes stop_codon:yes gene_type:complete
MSWRNLAVPVTLFIVALGWFASVFSQYSSGVAIRADGTIKLEKAIQWYERGSFYYEYPQKELDPEERGIAYHLSGAMPHLTTYENKRVITYPESFAIFVGIWQAMLPSSSLAWISILFFLVELAAFLWLARSALELSLPITLLGGLLFLFCTPHYIFSLQLQEVVVASSLLLVAIALFLKQENNAGAAISGALASIAFSVRQEVVIAALLLCILVFAGNEWRFWKGDNSRQARSRSGFTGLIGGLIKRNDLVFVFGVTFLIGFAIYLAYNTALYGEALGSRYEAVKDGSSGIAARWHIFRSILVGNFDPARPVLGLLAQMPFLMLYIAMPFLYGSLSREARFLGLLGIITAISVALISPNDSWGGWGQRFTMIVHGPLILGFLAILQKLQTGKSRRLLRSLALISVSFLVAGAFWLASFGWKLERQTLNYTAEIQSDLRRVRSLPETENAPVISTADLYYWAGLEYFKQPLFQLREDSSVASDLDYFIERAKDSNINYIVIRDSAMYREKEKNRYDSLIQHLEKERKIKLESIPETESGTERFYRFRVSDI